VKRTRSAPHITWLDLAVAAALLGFAVYLAYRIKVGIQYKWNWAVIPQYLFRYDAEQQRWVPNLIMQGFFTTIRLSVWSTLLATVIGTVMGFTRISVSLFKRMVGRTYVELIRNIPPLVLIFIFYFFLGDQLMTALHMDDFIRDQSESTQAVLSVLFAPPARFSAFLSALIALALYEGAYITEIIRAGIQSIERGQWEASGALGFSWLQQMRYIILPQAFQRILPALAGQFISAIKDSAIVSVISIQELTFQGMELMAATYLTFEVWLVITALYFVLTFSCSLLIRQLELTLRKNE
jgi:polar amino acid transport system permease protein